MRIGKLHFRIEKNYAIREDMTHVGVEFIPCLTFRYLKAKFGKELNLYVSWLLWVFSITYHKANEGR